MQPIDNAGGLSNVIVLDTNTTVCVTACSRTESELQKRILETFAPIDVDDEPLLMQTHVIYHIYNTYQFAIRCGVSVCAACSSQLERASERNSFPPHHLKSSDFSANLP